MKLPATAAGDDSPTAAGPDLEPRTKPRAVEILKIIMHSLKRRQAIPLLCPSSPRHYARSAQVPSPF